MKFGVYVVLLFLVTLKFLFCFLMNKKKERFFFKIFLILGIALQFYVSIVNTFLSNINFPIFIV